MNIWLISTLFLVAMATSACNRRVTGSDKPTEAIAPYYVQRSGYDTVVVFVHGLFGDARSTWTNDETHNYFPELLKKDAELSRVDIFVHSFASPFVTTTYTIDELVEQMRNVFDQQQVFERHQKVVFVCHSLGGVVVRAYLKRFENARKKVSLIYNFAVPTNGSQLATAAQYLSKNGQLKGLLPIAANEFLSSIQNDWRAFDSRPYTRCAYEIQPTFHLVRAVELDSATALCDGSVDPIDATHMRISKPKDEKDRPFSVFRQAFIESASGASLSSPSGVDSDEDDVSRRTVPVDCGQDLDTTIDVELLRHLHPQERVARATASIEKQEYLKTSWIEPTAVVNLFDNKVIARVHLRSRALDRLPTGVCSHIGTALVSVKFQMK